jgi:cytochrome c556
MATTLFGVLLLSSGPSPAQPQTPAHEHKLTLRAIMQELGAEYLRLANALLTDDVQALEQSAKAIETHPLPNEIVDAVKQRLGREFSSFERVDALSHRGAASLARAASAGNLSGAAKAFGELTSGCVGCHKLFRAKLKSLSD